MILLRPFFIAGMNRYKKSQHIRQACMRDLTLVVLAVFTMTATFFYH